MKNRLTDYGISDRILSDDKQSVFLFVNNLAQSRLKKTNRLLVISQNAPVFLYDLMKFYIPPVIFEISKSLTPAQFKLYIYLVYLWQINRKKSVIRTDRQISQEIKLSQYTIPSAIKKLKETKLIDYKRGMYIRQPTNYTIQEDTIDNYPESPQKLRALTRKKYDLSTTESPQKLRPFKDKIYKEDFSFFKNKNTIPTNKSISNLNTEHFKFKPSYKIKSISNLNINKEVIKQEIKQERFFYPSNWKEETLKKINVTL